MPDVKSTLPKRSYTGHYHFRATSPLQLHFEVAGDLKAAVERFQVHCTRMDYKFIKVRPMIVDLDEREKARNDDENFDARSS